MLNVAGGKLTTYRRIALEALRRLQPELGLRRLDTAPWRLPGAAGGGQVSFPPELEPDVRDHLLGLYGSRARLVLEPAFDDPSLLERLHPGGPEIAAEVLFAASHEWARNADDVVRRRTTLFHRGLADESTVADIEQLLSRAVARS
jgi:glycerol-3-phosphate dehydrogenase